jgi:hypothetical protein
VTFFVETDAPNLGKTLAADAREVGGLSHEVRLFDRHIRNRAGEGPQHVE